MASIGRSSALLASGTVVSRILGFISAVVLARTLGLVGSGADAFALANQLPNNVYAIVAGGVLSAVLVPHIIKSHLNVDGGAAYINKLLTLGILIFGAIALLATLAAPLFVSLYAQQTSGTGGAGFDSATVQLAVAFAWWCLPQVFFYAVYSLLGEVLNARGLFGPFTWAPVLNNVVAIAGMLWLGSVFTGSVTSAEDWSGFEIAILAGTATLGVATQSLILFGFLSRAGIRFRPDFGFRGVGLRDTSKVAAWTFGMIIVTQIAGIVQSNVASLATASGDPGLAVLRFGWLVFMLPHSVVTVSLVTAYFTRMSTAVRDDNWTGLSRDIRDSLARIGFFMVLASAGLWMTSGHIAAVFSNTADVGLGGVVSLFAIALVPFGVVFVLQRVFYALGDTKTPFYVQIVQAVAFSVGAVITAYGPTSQIAFGLALSLSASTWIHALVMGFVLNRRLGKLFDVTEVASLGRFALALVPSSIAGWGTSLLFSEVFGVRLESSLSTHLLVAGAIAVVMSATYVAALLVLRDETTKALLAPLRRRGDDRA
jgi:putative peptidoglycan lipid II flippase